MSNQSTAVRHIRILLVEDNPGDALMTQEAFEDAGIAASFETVNTAEAAVQYLDEHVSTSRPLPDFVLLDLNLPTRPGLHVLQHIRETETLTAIPTVMLTSSRAPEDVTAAYRAHANTFITKPVSADDFLEVVRSFENFWLGVAQLPDTGLI